MDPLTSHGLCARVLQASFQALLEPLKTLDYDALDVTANGWFDDFRLFTFGARDLDLLLCNIIELAYDSTRSARGQVELTEVGVQNPHSFSIS